MVRIASLPASAIESFGSDFCRSQLELRQAHRQELNRWRAELAGQLHMAIPDLAEDARRFILAVKRDVVCGRGLSRHRESPHWDVLGRLDPVLVARILGLEENLRHGDFAVIHDGEQAREGRHLLSLLEQPGFLRGLALASPALARHAQNLEMAGVDAWPEGERKLLATLLRHAGNAALELSPDAAWPRVGLAAWQDTPAGRAGGPSLAMGDWRERSRLRLKRDLLEQLGQVLLLYPPFRRHVPVALNSSVEEIDGEAHFVRPPSWVLEKEAQKPRYLPAAVARIRLKDGVIARWRETLAGGPRGYGKLVAACAEGIEDLESLLRVGFLYFQCPWAQPAARMERALLDYLRALPSSGLEGIIELLAEIDRIESAYASSADPCASLEELHWLFAELWATAVGLAGLAPDFEVDTSRVPMLSEDVILTHPSGGKVLEVRDAGLREALANVEPWARILHLHGFRHDFLHTLAVYMSERWPRCRVGVLELFQAVRPLWTEYCRFTKSRPGFREGWTAAFNPFGLERIDALRRLKQSIWWELNGGLATLASAGPLAREHLESLAEGIPDPYRPALGPCLCLQPAGDLWVMNRLGEGTGRFGSRFTPVMGGAARRSYLGALRRAAPAQDGRGELLDLMCPHSRLWNVHEPQTRRVLAFPGETPELAGVEVLGLAEISVEVDPELHVPVLVGPDGPCLPVHLGGSSLAAMPPLVHFLALLGGGEMMSGRPLALPVQQGNLTVRGRFTVGNLVMSRRSWSFRPGVLLSRVAGLSESDAFAAIHDWYRAHGMPRRVVLRTGPSREWASSGFSDEERAFRYVDFDSPFLVASLRSTLARVEPGRTVTLEEMLPTPEMFPADESGERWAVELQLESLTLREQRRPEELHPVALKAWEDISAHDGRLHVVNAPL